ncbi:MAG: DUF2798 domain-containing protein [Rhizobiaceae bacterium]|nr:DUF2798 domain-containing protein [Rhizobiaceae bacterium]
MSKEIRVKILTGVFISLVMSVCFSGVFTFLRFGWSAEWLKMWAMGFSMGWPIAFISVAIIGEPLNRLARKLVG